MKAPHPGKQRRGNAEGDHVSERGEFPAEIAGGVGHARDAAVQTVEQYGEADGLGGEVQVPGFTRGAMHGLQNGVEPRRDICRGEQRWQYVHALAQFSAWTVRFTTTRCLLFHVQCASMFSAPPCSMFSEPLAPRPCRHELAA